MGSKEKVDFFAFNSPTAILNDSISVTVNVHDGAEWIFAGVSGNRTRGGLSPSGGNTYSLLLSLIFPITDRRSTIPVTVPPTAFTAFAVTGHLHGDNLVCLPRRCRNTAASR